MSRRKPKRVTRDVIRLMTVLRNLDPVVYTAVVRTARQCVEDLKARN